MVETYEEQMDKWYNNRVYCGHNKWVSNSYLKEHNKPWLECPFGFKWKYCKELTICPCYECQKYRLRNEMWK